MAAACGFFSASRQVASVTPYPLTRLADTISSNVIAIEAQYEVSVEVVALSPSEVPLRVPVEMNIVLFQRIGTSPKGFVRRADRLRAKR